MGLYFSSGASYRPQANWGGQLLLMNWGRKSHFKRIGPTESVGAHPCTCKSLLLQAASVFRGHESRPDRAEGGMYVHGGRPGRAEGVLYVQPTCLDVQSILCTFKLSRKSINHRAWTCRETSARLLRRVNRTEGFLHVHGSKLCRVENTLYVGPFCPDVQRSHCTDKLLITLSY